MLFKVDDLKSSPEVVLCKLEIWKNNVEAHCGLHKIIFFPFAAQTDDSNSKMNMFVSTLAFPQWVFSTVIQFYNWTFSRNALSHTQVFGSREKLEICKSVVLKSRDHHKMLKPITDVGKQQPYRWQMQCNYPTEDHSANKSNFKKDFYFYFFLVQVKLESEWKSEWFYVQ